MNYLIAFTFAFLAWGAVSYAQDMEIEVPNGWTATESGLVKGNNELSIGPVLDLGDLNPAGYLGKLAEVPPDGLEITKIGELKDGKLVVQVLRDVTAGESKARATLFICKGGRNKHRLLELFTDDVFALISGGKAAIGFCEQP